MTIDTTAPGTTAQVRAQHWSHRWRLIGTLRRLLPAEHPLPSRLIEPVHHALDRDPDGAVVASRDAIACLEHMLEAMPLEAGDDRAALVTLLDEERSLLALLGRHHASARAQRQRRLLAGLEVRSNLRHGGPARQLFGNRRQPSQPCFVVIEGGRP